MSDESSVAKTANSSVSISFEGRARRIAGALGPGLLFAATSVGTSHLVQSTRAGALYGLSLILIVVAAHAIKYPAFRIASDYFPATGVTLLEAYRQQGRWALAAYFLITMSTLIFAVSVLALLCAGLIKVIFSLPVPSSRLAVGLIAATGVLLSVGHYKTLERVTKILVFFMVTCTVVATVLVVPEIRLDAGLRLYPEMLDITTLMFIAALVGWMPVPLDVSIWQTLWAKAKSRSDKNERSQREVRIDFNLGFFGTLTLALCFICLGAGLMNSNGILPVGGSVEFSAQLIDIYQNVFGSKAGPLVGIAALAVVYSSLLAVMDGFPRALSTLHRRWKQIPEATDSFSLSETSPFYLSVLIAMGIGAAITYQFFLTSLTSLVDVAATIAFVTAPLIAFLNHKAITSGIVAKQYRPGKLFKAYSTLSIMILAVFAAGYLYLRFFDFALP